LYREVCVLLFFRYGITPTANKLYQYVRRGSMSAPADALNKFWSELREKSRVRIERPDIPENISTLAGDLIANLWNEAQKAAQAGFSELVDNATSEILKYRLQSEVAEQKSKENRQLLTETQAELENALKRLSETENLRQVDINTLAHKEKSLKSLENEKSFLEIELTKGQANFLAQVDKLHDSLKISDQRFRALESKALLDVDRERQRAAMLAKEISRLNQAITKTRLSNNYQLSKQEVLINSLRENIGMLKGQLKESQRHQADAMKILNRVKK
ncbi:MAG: hypothetical protein CTY35_00700, partial [Methylotenera sp.]|uniref:DNA-binding protein n=1 Tax=Methylotenera sp. TaxID=2051956 RepID=UPI000D48F80E